MASLEHTCVLGRGMIGTAIKNELRRRGVTPTPYPDKQTKYIFDMRGTTHQLYEQYGDFLSMEAVTRFENMVRFCKDRKIKYIWPSSALVLEKDTRFARDKAMMEKTNGVLSLRLFPVYGNEAHKGENASVIYKWTEQMARGQRPTIYGDGTQGRDFINSRDVAIQAIELRDKVGVVNIGTGNLTEFNSIVRTINKVLRTDIQPIYVAAPGGYSEGIVSPNPVPTVVTLEQGIRRIVSDL